MGEQKRIQQPQRRVLHRASRVRTPGAALSAVLLSSFAKAQATLEAFVTRAIFGGGLPYLSTSRRTVAL